MLILLLLSITGVLLLLLLTFARFIIMEFSSHPSREELSSYECGFEHHSLSRLPVSIRYFMLTLVFLIFDIEVTLLAFYPMGRYIYASQWFTITIYLIFVLILIIGLIFE